MTWIPYLIAAVIACNIAVLCLATRNAAKRERAKRAAENVVEFPYYCRVDFKV